MLMTYKKVGQSNFDTDTTDGCKSYLKVVCLPLVTYHNPQSKK